MRLVDKDGNETDYELIEWGPGGVWGFEELRRDVVQRLPDYEGHDVSMGFDDQPRIAYNDIPLEVVEGFVERGLIAESYRFSVEALDRRTARCDGRVQLRRGGRLACRHQGRAAPGEGADCSGPGSVPGHVEDVPAPDRRGHRLSQSCMVAWFASGMASADAYDWCGDSYADLARAHELPIPIMEGLGASAEE
mgnify:FL=1